MGEHFYVAKNGGIRITRTLYHPCRGDIIDDRPATEHEIREHYNSRLIAAACLAITGISLVAIMIGITVIFAIGGGR